MPLVNIVDSRKRPYRFRKINAIVEAAWHDNSCINSDQVTRDAENDGPDYEEQEHVSLAEAIAWADSFPNDVTLFLYDEDGGIYPYVETVPIPQAQREIEKLDDHPPSCKCETCRAWGA